jgi:hypothetical protein
MTTLTMRPRNAGFVVSADTRAYEAVTVVGGVAPGLDAGTILGRITAGAATAAAQGGNTGNATIGTVTRLANVEPGVYQVEFIAATRFIVITPSGAVLGEGATGAVFNTGSHISFTITVGGTPMVVGDGFNVTVAAGSGNYAEYDPTNVDGSGQVAGVLWATQIGTSEATIIARDAEVDLAQLTYEGTEAAAVAGLAALGIIAR